MTVGTICALSMMVALPVVGLALQAGDGAAVAAVFPPWRNAAAATRATGATLVGPQPGRLVTVSRSEAPGQVAALYAAGAWLVLPADVLAFLCTGGT